MVPLASLWLPILLSSVIVFFASFLFHMVLTHHRSDYGQLPSEDDVMSSLRKFNIPPGDYFMPRAAGPSDMKNPEFKKKMEMGPVVVMTVMRSGDVSFGKRLVHWFLYCVVVGIFSGYVASRAVGPGTPYLTVFRFVGTVAFAGYALALWQDSIWYSRRWSTTIKSTVDSLVYALLTAGTFGWLWPR